jgi:hypothetical protein
MSGRDRVLSFDRMDERGTRRKEEVYFRGAFGWEEFLLLHLY